MDASKRGRGRPPREGGAKVSRSVRTDDPLWEDLQRIARAHGITTSALVELALTDVRERYQPLLDLWQGGTCTLPGYEGWTVAPPPPDMPELPPHLIHPHGRGSVSLEWAVAAMDRNASTPAELLAATATYCASHTGSD